MHLKKTPAQGGRRGVIVCWWLVLISSFGATHKVTNTAPPLLTCHPQLAIAVSTTCFANTSPSVTGPVCTCVHQPAHSPTQHPAGIEPATCSHIRMHSLSNRPRMLCCASYREAHGMRSCWYLQLVCCVRLVILLRCTLVVAAGSREPPTQTNNQSP